MNPRFGPYEGVAEIDGVPNTLREKDSPKTSRNTPEHSGERQHRLVRFFVSIDQAVPGAKDHDRTQGGPEQSELKSPPSGGQIRVTRESAECRLELDMQWPYTHL
ncbi:hypothetical protein COCOBI_14-3400 [Coccomyxa sp. Obi]|nr:hypothetical protein COCOBI_14-3400 [Coccomyxa sp. Obi]